MKKIILTVAILMGTMVAMSQLNTNAQYMKEKESLSDYYEGIKCAAVEQWGNDNSMIIYTINQEVNAFFEMLGLKEKVSGDFFSDAYYKWRNEDCGFTSWSMVLYEIKEQIKNSEY